eukprot:728728-Amphidinium_carterae.1
MEFSPAQKLDLLEDQVLEQYRYRLFCKFFGGYSSSGIFGEAFGRFARGCVCARSLALRGQDDPWSRQSANTGFDWGVRASLPNPIELVETPMSHTRKPKKPVCKQANSRRTANTPSGRVLKTP